MFDIDLNGAFGFASKILDRVVQDPVQKAESQQKLLELQQKGELELEGFAVKREEIASGDRDSARKREMATGDNTNKGLAWIIVVFWGALNFFIMFHGIPETVDDPVLYRLLGTLDAIVMLVLQYYFGSSASGRSKDATIQSMAAK